MTLLLEYALPATVTVLIGYILNSVYSYAKFIYDLRWISGPSPIQCLYQIWSNPSELYTSMTALYKKYGKTYKLWIGLKPIVQCQDLDIVQSIFNQEEKTCRPLLYILVRRYVGPGLLFGEADNKWRLHRKHLSESFHVDILEKNIDITMKYVRSLIDDLDRKIGVTEPIDLIEYMRSCFFDVTLGVTVGVKSSISHEKETVGYLDAMENMFGMVIRRLFSPLSQISTAFDLPSVKRKEEEIEKIIKQFIGNLVSKRKSFAFMNESDKDKKKIIADKMISLENLNVVSAQDTEDEVSNNILAADTVSIVTSFALFLLGNHDNIQKEVIDEINRFAPNILKDGITLKELNNFTCLDRCLKETLRLFPAAPMIGRHLLKPFVTKHGVLPAGTDVYVNLYNYHRDPIVYPLPDKFDPDRFLPENVRKRHPHSWIPFGLGIRTCIGQKAGLTQSKVAIAMFLKKYEVKSFEEHGELKLIPNLVIKTQNGLRVYLKKREEV